MVSLAVRDKANNCQEVVRHRRILVQLFHYLKLLLFKIYWKIRSKYHIHHVLHFFGQDFHQGGGRQLLHGIVLDLEISTGIVCIKVDLRSSMAKIDNNSFLYIVQERTLFELFHCSIFTTMNELEQIWIGKVQTQQESYLPLLLEGQNRSYTQNRRLSWQKGECGCCGMMLQLLPFHFNSPAQHEKQNFAFLGNFLFWSINHGLSSAVSREEDLVWSNTW